mgnify:CR=1 FL=1
MSEMFRKQTRKVRMSSTQVCGCGKPVFRVPVRGLELALDEEAFGGGLGAVPDLRFDRETRMNLRYLGKQVYARMIDFGPLPNNGIKELAHNIPDVDWIQVNQNMSIVHSGRFNNHPAACPVCAGAANSWYFTVTSEFIRFYTGIDRQNYSATVCLMYTKTTDEPLE